MVVGGACWARGETGLAAQGLQHSRGLAHPEHPIGPLQGEGEAVRGVLNLDELGLTVFSSTAFQGRCCLVANATEKPVGPLGTQLGWDLEPVCLAPELQAF